MLEQGPSERSGNGVLAELYAESWESDSSVPNVFSFLREHPDATPQQQVAVVLVDQARRAQLGILLPAEDYLETFTAVGAARELQLSRWSRTSSVCASGAARAPR